MPFSLVGLIGLRKLSSLSRYASVGIRNPSLGSTEGQDHLLGRVQKGDAIHALATCILRVKWDRLLSEAANVLSKNEFEKVDRFILRLSGSRTQGATVTDGK